MTAIIRFASILDDPIVISQSMTRETVLETFNLSIAINPCEDENKKVQ